MVSISPELDCPGDCPEESSPKAPPAKKKRFRGKGKKQLAKAAEFAKAAQRQAIVPPRSESKSDLSAEERKKVSDALVQDRLAKIRDRLTAAEARKKETRSKVSDSLDLAAISPSTDVSDPKPSEPAKAVADVKRADKAPAAIRSLTPPSLLGDIYDILLNRSA